MPKLQCVIAAPLTQSSPGHKASQHHRNFIMVRKIFFIKVVLQYCLKSSFLILKKTTCQKAKLTIQKEILQNEKWQGNVGIYSQNSIYHYYCFKCNIVSLLAELTHFVDKINSGVSFPTEVWDTKQY